MHFGDVVVVDENIDIESEEGRNAAYLLERTDRWSVLEDVLEEFDDVVEMLPREYSASEVQRATKGAAYGMKARTALHFASIRSGTPMDWEIPRKPNGSSGSQRKQPRIAWI